MTIHIRQPLPSPGIETLIDDALFAAPTGASYDRLAKRILDITIVLLGALPVLLVTMVLAAIIALDGKSPFYLQKRVGRNGRVFYMYKLRSMVVDADSRLEAYLASNPEARAEWNHAQKLRRDPRITAVGRLIRKTSLDELPQLLNVLRGDMSLVGPRPMMVEQQDLYPGTAYYALRPGITGFWQTSVRNESSFAERAGFDTDYLRQLSFGTDLKILARTVRVVLNGTGC
ncbi:sugar transferase [Salipiger bermudensis]|uniref:Bacterial sugar transferase n=1 Tax=Salipiger bermudensis (strain DSM 26914 / JCM 13377 / KCTC 12554 / HTCC2601) TaxID=314265 RepID=Q0FQK3_SALBH|nr:sugar transferase [Salipiger bermudensis]EAU46448.1 bacterial sugar transferase [Salipiger bermudensis HTCC2601]MBN9677206.1 sugar transferase [Salipiger bermudensis]